MTEMAARLLVLRDECDHGTGVIDTTWDDQKIAEEL
jgi:hypothetical protein